MKLRNRTCEKINNLQEDSSFEDDFKEALSSKSARKRKSQEKQTNEKRSNSKKKSQYFGKEYDSTSEIEQVKKKPKKNDKKLVKTAEKQQTNNSEQKEKKSEPLLIHDVKSELNKIENIENKIDLLLKFESNNLKVNNKIKKEDVMSDLESDDSGCEKIKEEDEEDFEEVEMQHISLNNTHIGKEEIQITIGGKKAKKPVDLQAKMERMFKNLQKKFSVTMLKTHLLCWIAHGFFLNDLSRNKFVRALAISIDFHSENFQLVNFNKENLKNLIQNINSIFATDQTLNQKDDFFNCGKQSQSIKLLGKVFSNKKFNNYLQYLLIVLVLMRNLNIKVRICLCLDVIPVNKESKKVIKKSNKSKEIENTEDSDEEDSIKKQSNKKFKKEKKNNLILSMDESKLDTDDNNFKLKSTNYRNYWLEAYLEEEKYWCPFEPFYSKIDCADWIEKRFESEILYVLAFDNENKIKDVTKRYSSDWCIKTRLSRISYLDDKKLWWEKTLAFHQPTDPQMDMEEEKWLKKILLKKPVPQSIGEFKDHPLYILPRHLLKFQAIYPQNAVPVTHFKNEPVYSRDNLVTLCSKQTWLKYARTVKHYEKPYKIVKGRLKRVLNFNFFVNFCIIFVNLKIKFEKLKKIKKDSIFLFIK